jgi:hypothetical protein
MDGNPRTRRALIAVRKVFRTEKRALTVNEVANIMGKSVRGTRDWLNQLHANGDLFIESYRETTALRGKKLPAYRLRKTGKEQDAQKWWLDPHETDSEGGHCD